MEWVAGKTACSMTFPSKEARVLHVPPLLDTFDVQELEQRLRVAS